MTNKTIVIYHKSDFDGIFCREIAKKFIPDATLIGWEYGDKVPEVKTEDTLYILDLSVDALMGHPNLIWIDHHKSTIDKYPSTINGYRIDGVAACRLTWQWFTNEVANNIMSDANYLPTKEQYVNRQVTEPLSVQLAGEYDIWDKRNPNAELFQHGLRSEELNWNKLLSTYADEAQDSVLFLLQKGQAIQYFQTKQNESIIKSSGFDLIFEGLTFLACNNARYNSFLFTAGIKPEHEGLLGFNFDGSKWKISLYGVPNKDIDLSKIAIKYGGGGHKQACGFTCKTLPFII